MASRGYVESFWSKSSKYLPKIDLDFAEKWTNEEHKVLRKVFDRGYSNYCKENLMIPFAFVALITARRDITMTVRHVVLDRKFA